MTPPQDKIEKEIHQILQEKISDEVFYESGENRQRLWQALTNAEKALLHACHRYSGEVVRELAGEIEKEKIFIGEGLTLESLDCKLHYNGAIHKVLEIISKLIHQKYE